MDNNTKNTSKKREYTDKNTGKFKEGNPGKPKGAKNKFSIAMLEEAIEAEEKAVGEQKGFSVGVFQQFVRMAYREPSVMIALMRKFVADKQHTEISGLEPLKFIVEILNGNKKPKGE